MSATRPGHSGCHCCDPSFAGNLGIQVADIDHRWGEGGDEPWPHPFTIETETFGSAIINSLTVSEGRPAEYGVLFGNLLVAGQTSLRLDFDITTPSGKWSAWAIAWIPAPPSNYNMQETVATDDPSGFTLLSQLRNACVVRLRKISTHNSPPYTVSGMVIEYGGVKYYKPYAYMQEYVEPRGRWLRCWQCHTNIVNVLDPVPDGFRALTVNADASYGSHFQNSDCNPSPAAITRIGHVFGFSTVGETAQDDREFSGTFSGSIEADALQLAGYYSSNCLCWFDGITSLNMDIEIGPAEVQGQSITLTLQGDGTYTGSGTYDSGNKTYNVTYTPCVSLTLMASDCDGDEGPIAVTVPHQPRSDIEDGGYYAVTDNWAPIDVRYERKVCYVGIGGIGTVPACGLTANTTCPIGSPPFQVIHPGINWAFRISE